MATTMKTQVAIIGAGPAGLLLAHLLQKAGVDSIVIDGRTKQDIEGTVKAGIVEHPAATVLKESGASERVMNDEYRHDGIIFDFDGQSHRFDFKKLVNKGVYLFPQHETLIDLIAARTRAGNPPLFEHLAEKIIDENTTNPKVVGRTVQGDEFEIAADVVVGADGSASIARIAVNGSQTSGYFREYPFAWFGILTEAPMSADELIYSRSEEGFVLISTRTPEIQRMYFQCDPNMDTASISDDDIWAKLQLGVKVELKRGPIFRKDVLRFRSFVASGLRNNRIFLAGDAAHTVPPTGAKGMNLAFSDVLWLFQALRAFFTDGSEKLMDSYQKDALDRIWKAQNFSYWMTSMLHIAPEASDFDKKRQLGELYSVTSSDHAKAYIAESYVGWDYGADWK